MLIREAKPEDAKGLNAFLQELSAIGKRTMPSDEDYVSNNYIAHPDYIVCTVAQDHDGTLLGLQILKHASIDNIYGVTPGWGIIGTHVSPHTARRGAGKALFASTKAAAIKAKLQKIDATIGDTNPEGLAYYEAMGFRSYKSENGKTSKCYVVST